MKFACSKTRFQVDGVDLNKKEFMIKLRNKLKNNRIKGEVGKNNNERRETKEWRKLKGKKEKQMKAEN